MRNELLNIECEKFGEKIPLLDFIYIIPTRKKHDSHYNIMEIIGENNKGYRKKLATFCDVVDLEKYIGIYDHWLISMDVPEYNVIRLFSHHGMFKIIDYGISTFSFEVIDRKILKEENYEKW